MTTAISNRPKQRFYSIEDTATFLGVSTSTVRRKVKGRELRHYRVGGQIRIAMEDIEQYLALRRVDPAI